nr:hypothetical protein CPAG_03869 [Coccidioides posadasii RMSCC 3488]
MAIGDPGPKISIPAIREHSWAVESSRVCLLTRSIFSVWWGGKESGHFRLHHGGRGGPKVPDPGVSRLLSSLLGASLSSNGHGIVPGSCGREKRRPLSNPEPQSPRGGPGSTWTAHRDGPASNRVGVTPSIRQATAARWWVIGLSERSAAPLVIPRHWTRQKRWWRQLAGFSSAGTASVHTTAGFNDKSGKKIPFFPQP